MQKKILNMINFIDLLKVEYQLDFLKQFLTKTLWGIQAHY